MKRYTLGTVALLVLAGLVGLLSQACVTSRNAPSGAPENSGAVNGLASEGGASHALMGGSGSGGGGAAAAPVVATGLQRGELVGPKVIETAQLSLTTKKGRFDDAYQRANEVAGRYRGYVETSASEGVRTKSGSLTLRVPSQYFQAALHDLRGLGTVTAQSVTGQDVTSQYVDLQARLRNWQAQAAVLLTLMGKATTIGDTLRIQNELSTVQLRIEELKGQLRVLDNQTSYSTIEVSMRESGVALVAASTTHRSGLARAWHDAVHGFVGVISAVVVGLGYLIPIALLLGLIWLAVRRWLPKVPAA